jgi:hypothetical protein
MAPHAVAEIDAPRQSRRDPVGAVGEAIEVAADPSDCHRGGDRDREQIARAPRHAEPPLRPFDRDRAAEQSAHDRLAVEPREDRAPRCRSQHRRDDYPVAVGLRKKVAGAPALAPVERESGGIGQRLE